MKQTEEIPQHHYPIVHGLHLATGQEANDAYTLFWQEVSSLAARVRQRRQERQASESEALQPAKRNARLSDGAR